MKKIENEKNINAEKDFNIIRPYLEKIGYDFKTDDYSKYVKIYIARKDDIRYLAFGIHRFEGMPFWSEVDETKYGQVVFNTKGDVLLDCVKEEMPGFRFNLDYGYEYDELDSSRVFNHDKVLIGKSKKEDTF